MNTPLKDTITTMVILAVVFIAGAWLNGRRVDHQWKDRIEHAPFVLQSFERYIDVPVPGKPIPIPGKATKDTSGIAAAIDSMHAIYADSLTVMRQLAQPFTGEHADSGIYLRATANPVRRMIIIDSLWLRPVRCDSIVATKVVLQRESGATWQTAACVAIGAAAGASVADETGAAVGAVLGIGVDWLIEKVF